MVTLFEPTPKKIGLFREKWVCVEFRLGFPFLLKSKALRVWRPIKKNTKYSDRKFLDYVRSKHGDDSKPQTKIFITGKLIADESRYPCGIVGLSVDNCQRELHLEDNDEYPVWRLHPMNAQRARTQIGPTVGWKWVTSHLHSFFFAFL